MQSQVKADVRNEIIEKSLAIECRPRKGEGERSGVFDTNGQRRADIADSSTWDGSKARVMGLVPPPFGEAAVRRGSPRAHPYRHDREEALVGREFAFALAEARVRDVKQGIGDDASALHRAQDLGEEA